jgi:hypothetical protein
MMTDNHPEIERSLGRIESKLDNALQVIDRHTNIINELKTYQDKQSGAVVAWSISFSALGSAIAVVASYVLNRMIQ